MIMAEYGEWNKKGATLSDVTAKKEYGVEQELIIRVSGKGNWNFGKVISMAIPICGFYADRLGSTWL